MARRDAESIISKLRQVSEEGLGSVMGELMANERMRKGLGRAGERLMANKHVFDRNVETVLDFVNIPSKRDIRELKSRLDTLSSQLVNLSIKIDRMLAADDTPAPRHVRAADPVTPVRPVRPAPAGPRPVPRRRKAAAAQQFRLTPRGPASSSRIGGRWLHRILSEIARLCPSQARSASSAGSRPRSGTAASSSCGDPPARREAIAAASR